MKTEFKRLLLAKLVVVTVAVSSFSVTASADSTCKSNHGCEDLYQSALKLDREHQSCIQLTGGKEFIKEQVCKSKEIAKKAAFSELKVCKLKKKLA